jgi:uncharacterized protein (DUF983 family)
VDDPATRRTPPRIRAFDLVVAVLCEECGRPKSNRPFEILTGCTTCDEVITRHRCTGRPDVNSLRAGLSWTCPECDSVWTVTEAETGEPCEECGLPRAVATWQVEPGARLATAPRYVPRKPDPVPEPTGRSRHWVTPYKTSEDT